MTAYKMKQEVDRLIPHAHKTYYWIMDENDKFNSTRKYYV